VSAEFAAKDLKERKRSSVAWRTYSLALYVLFCGLVSAEFAAKDLKERKRSSVAWRSYSFAL
jgi:hypothetical protein